MRRLVCLVCRRNKDWLVETKRTKKKLVFQNH
jgi:hypothetical protein